MGRKPITFLKDERRQRRRRRVRRLLQLALLGFVIVAIAGISLYFHRFIEEQKEMAARRLETFAELRLSAVRRFLLSHQQETALWSQEKTLTSVARQYIEIWRRMTEEEKAGMRYLFVPENRRTIKARRLSSITDAYADYTELHALTYANLRRFMRHHGYYDIFFFTPEGDLAFTVMKEDDFGLNFTHNGGPYAATGLGRAFRAANALHTGGRAVFMDFSFYPPSNNAPAAFFAAPMFDERDRKIGIYAIQIPVDRLDAILRHNAGMGQSVRTYAVGEDLLLRNNLPDAKEPTLLRRKVDIEPVKRALQGKRVSITMLDEHGERRFLVALPMNFAGVRWAIVTDMALEEMHEPIRPYYWLWLFSVGIIVLLGGVQIWLLQRW